MKSEILGSAPAYFVERPDLLYYLPWAKAEAKRRTADRMEGDLAKGIIWPIPLHQKMYLQILAPLLGGTVHYPCPQSSETDAEDWFQAKLDSGPIRIPGSAYQQYFLRGGKVL